jgi:hypothetical protein
MEAELIIKSIMGLIALLALLIILLFFEPNKEKKLKKNLPKTKAPIKEEENNPKSELLSKDIELNTLVSVIKNKKSDAKKLEEALDLIIKHHGSVHKKLGLRPHPDFAVYEDVLFTLCRHPNANKDLIINFDRELGKLNPEYKQEMNEAITKGLNSRGI